MLTLGIETSCDETGVALYDAAAGGLLAHAVHSQVDMHQAYGGVVPELASRDHVRRLVPLARGLFERSGRKIAELQAIAYTEGPGLAGALLVGASFAHALAAALGVPALGIHHLEGHLLSPLLSARPPAFPFVALLVSGGHTQLMRVEGVGRYELLGETQDDAAGEAFDKTAHLLGLGYPGGPALSKLAEHGHPGRHKLPRPMIASGDLEFSFSGLKTAAMLLVRGAEPNEQFRADVARGPRDGLGVVAGRHRDEPARAVGGRQRQHLVERAARLERSGLLEALALEPQRDAGARAERLRRGQGRAVERAGEALGRRADLGEGDHGRR